MIRPALYFLAGLLAGPMTMFVRDLWLLAVGVPDATSSWTEQRVAAALTALVVGVAVGLAASFIPRRRRRAPAVGGKIPPKPAPGPRQP